MQFTQDLITKPKPELGKILITGATGYIGGRLVPELISRGYKIRVMVRAMTPTLKEQWPEVEVAVGDALSSDALTTALEGIHTAYYLIHSLLLGPKSFETADITAARNFKNAAEKMGVQRIIYLGGLGDLRTALSAHLNSRIMVAQELMSGKVPATFLRAAIIIGSGSASYEMIANLVKNTPVIFVPKWATTKCQPIAIRDVIKYLVGALETPETTGKSFDIGGQDVLSYEMMLKTLASIHGKKRLFLSMPFSNVKFYAYIMSLITPVPAQITMCLMESCHHDVICLNDDIKRYIPFEPLSYKEALLKAMSREKQDDIATRWSDAYPPAHELALKLHELTAPPEYINTYSLETDKSAASLFNAIIIIGGKKGWFNSNFLWRIRGWFDRLFMGVGSSRGRRSLSNLRINDVIDFWRVESLIPEQKLLLRAEMKMPGRAWLEFKIDPLAGKNRLSVTAYFQAKGLPGKLYWYAFLPFHHFIFQDLITQIERKC